MHEEENATQHTRMSELEMSINSTSDQLVEEQRELAKYKAAFRRLEDLGRRTSACRNCGSGFGAIVEKDRGLHNVRYVLRCKECKCIHRDSG